MKRFRVFSNITGRELADGVEFDDTTCAMHFHVFGRVIAGPRGGISYLLDNPEFARYRFEWVD